MRMWLIAAAALLLAGPVAARQPAPRASSSVAIDGGGFALGRADAPLRLAVYASLTCPTCARLDLAMTPGLKRWLDDGLVRLEARPYLLNVADLAAQTVARCGGAARFFAISHRLYASQPQWLGRLRAAGPARLEAIGRQPPAARLAALARLMQIDRMALAEGVTAPALARCLADPAGPQRLVDWTRAAYARGVRGTPSIFLNDRPVDALDWPALEAELTRAAKALPARR